MVVIGMDFAKDKDKTSIVAVCRLCGVMGSVDTRLCEHDNRTAKQRKTDKHRAASSA